ncbi:MAG: DOMON domain-containing protein [Armatimonadota bacterium]
MIKRNYGVAVLPCAILILSIIVGVAQTGQGAAIASARVEASALQVKAVGWKGNAAAIVDPANAVWKSASPLRILLNITPRIVVTDKISRSAPPEVSVQCVRASDGTVVRLTWKDATKDKPNVRRPSPADAGGRVRVIHTDKTNRSYDAAAVMVPVNRNPTVNPCIQMGEKADPVELYFWQAVRGAAVMTASGRATTLRTSKTFPSKAVYSNGGWQVTFVLPKLPNRTPLAFAIWDGSKGQRGGLKYYSLWHSLRSDGLIL